MPAEVLIRLPAEICSRKVSVYPNSSGQKARQLMTYMRQEIIPIGAPILEGLAVRAGSAMIFLPLASIFSFEFSDLRPTEGAILLAVAHSG